MELGAMSGDRERPEGERGGAHAPAPAADAAGGGPPGAAGEGELGVEDLLPLAIPGAARRGAGRPRGSQNIRTAQTAQVILGRYGDPLIASAALGAMDTLVLARWLRTIASDAGLKLGMTVGDIVRLQESCRAAVLPYIHAKRAPTNEAGETVTPVIALGRFETHVHAGAGGGRSIEDAIDVTPAAADDVEQNQGLSGEPEGKSHG